MERGDLDPPASTLKKLASCFDVTFSHLLRREF
ncbi:MAG: helix-turn-helix transcriptional regulator [Polyangiaceae bacterium]|nr:helix-turn-helix transcriptional regulator [Polyangiaceae bacterium]